MKRLQLVTLNIGMLNETQRLGELIDIMRGEQVFSA
jgi:hypothetical protein